MVSERRNTVVRRRQIVSAARRLIVKYGSEHVTVRRMAREIGVSEAAIYRHFKSKRDILSFLVDDIEKTLLGDVQDNGKASENPLKILENIMQDHISAIEQRKGITFLVIAEILSLGDKKLNQKIYDVIERYITRIKKELSEGVKAGVVKQDIDLEAAATLVFGMTQGMVNMWALSNYSFDLQQRCLPLWKILLQAIQR